MSTPLRVNDQLFQDAEVEASLMNRSTAKQVEFWAELGKRMAHSISPADLLALMQGIAQVRIEIPEVQAVNPDRVFTKVDKVSKSEEGALQLNLTGLYYETSSTQAGLLDQVMPDGRRQTGRFKKGLFEPV